MGCVAIVTLPCGHNIRVTAHAVDRYWERVHPALPSWETARDDLKRLLRTHGQLVGIRPAWAADEGLAENADRWLLAGPDVALPIFGWHAVTVLCHGHISETVRDRRNDQKAQLRFKRHRARRGDRNQNRAAAARRREQRGPGLEDQAA